MYEWCNKNNINVATFESGWSIENEVALELNYSPSPQHLFTFDDRKLSEHENKKLKEYIEKKGFHPQTLIHQLIKKLYQYLEMCLGIHPKQFQVTFMNQCISGLIV